MCGRGGWTSALSAAALLWAATAPAADDPPSSTPLVVRESAVVLQSDARDAARRVQEIVRTLGAQLVRATDSEVVVDVPTTQYSRLLEALRAAGYVSSERVSTRDVSLELARVEADARAAHTRVARVQGLSSKASDVQGHLLVEQEIQRATREEDAARRTRGVLLRRSTLTRVTLHLEQPPVETFQEPNLPFPWLDRLGLPELLDPSSGTPETHRVLRAFLEANLSLRLGHAADAERFGGPTKLGAASLSLRTLGEANPVGVFGGFDLSLGAGGGVLYGAQTILGLGLPIGERLAIGIGSGPGVDGIKGVVPAGFTVPIELYVSLDTASWLSTTLWLQDGWVPGSDARHAGAKHAPFGDELAAGVQLGFGGRSDGYYSQDRFGPLVGFVYREQMDARIFEIRLGVGGHTSDFSETQ